MVKEFKEFLMRGNVMDLAVAVVIGAAFGAIITSLVNDILMPIIGAILGGTDLTTLSITVGDAVITYGNFLQAIINFVLIAFAIFLIVKAYNKSQKAKEEAPAPPPGPSAEEKLLTEIRDLLAKRS
jgi:large conductance mechanosensitive channel